VLVAGESFGGHSKRALILDVDAKDRAVVISKVRANDQCASSHVPVRHGHQAALMSV
jgi:hypothetical protein